MSVIFSQTLTSYNLLYLRSPQWTTLSFSFCLTKYSLEVIKMNAPVWLCRPTSTFQYFKCTFFLLGAFSCKKTDVFLP